MTLAFTAPPCPDSPLRRFDPRWKLAALVPCALAASLLHTLVAALLALAGAMLLAGLARLPPRWLLRRLGVVFLFLILFAAPLPLLLAGDGGAWHLGPLSIYRHGVLTAVLVSAKVTAVAVLGLVVLATAPLDATLKAAHALRLPGLLVQLSLLTYRYLHLLAEELRRLRIALRVRGFRQRTSRHSYRTLGHVAGTLLVRGYERAERVEQAMRCRGFTGQFRSLIAFRTTCGDVLAFALILAILTGIEYLDWR